VHELTDRPVSTGESMALYLRVHGLCFVVELVGALTRNAAICCFYCLSKLLAKKIEAKQIQPRPSPSLKPRSTRARGTGRAGGCVGRRRAYLGNDKVMPHNGQ
jgi:hypothetical protein